MKRILLAVGFLSVGSSLQAAGIIATATDTGVVTVLDKSKPTQAILQFRPYNSSRILYLAVGETNNDGQDEIVTGAGPGVSGGVKVFSQNGDLVHSFLPYGGFAGGVRVAVGDVNGDGVGDIITGAGAGFPGGHVKVFSGVSFGEIRSFFAYGPAFTGGVFVAAGDINGDGFADIITGPDAVTGPDFGGGPHVKVFDGWTGRELRSFFAYDPGFTGGVRVAGGDVDGDGKVDIITAPGAGAPAHVKAFDGLSNTILASFLAFDAAFTGGVYVAGGSVMVTPSAPSGGIATIRIFGSDGRVQWLMPFPGYTGGLTVAASAGVMGKTSARPRILR